MHALMWTAYNACQVLKVMVQGAILADSSAINIPWPSLLLYDPADFRGDAVKLIYELSISLIT